MMYLSTFGVCWLPTCMANEGSNEVTLLEGGEAPLQQLKH